MSWTDERIDRLKTMWEKGLTASQIADELGGVSRNAVIGKAHRLGLKSRPSPVKANEGEAKPAPKPKAKPVEKAAAPRASAPSSGSTERVIPAYSTPSVAQPRTDMPKIVSIGPGGFMRQGPGDQQAPSPPAPPRGPPAVGPRTAAPRTGGPRRPGATRARP